MAMPDSSFPEIPANVLARNKEVQRTWRPSASAPNGTAASNPYRNDPARDPITGAKKPPAQFYGRAGDYSQAGLRSALGIQIDPATGEAGGIHPDFGKTHSSRLNPETGQWEEVPYHVAYSTTPGWRPDPDVQPVPDPGMIQESEYRTRFGSGQPLITRSPSQYDTRANPWELAYGMGTGAGPSSFFLPGTTALANQMNGRRRRQDQAPQTMFGPQTYYR
jgi:hypothetical protein